MWQNWGAWARVSLYILPPFNGQLMDPLASTPCTLCPLPTLPPCLHYRPCELFQQPLLWVQSSTALQGGFNSKLFGKTQKENKDLPSLFAQSSLN